MLSLVLRATFELLIMVNKDQHCLDLVRFFVIMILICYFLFLEHNFPLAPGPLNKLPRLAASLHSGLSSNVTPSERPPLTN